MGQEIPRLADFSLVIGRVSLVGERNKKNTAGVWVLLFASLPLRGFACLLYWVIGVASNAADRRGMGQISGTRLRPMEGEIWYYGKTSHSAGVFLTGMGWEWNG